MEIFKCALELPYRSSSCRPSTKSTAGEDDFVLCCSQMCGSCGNHSLCSGIQRSLWVKFNSCVSSFKKIFHLLECYWLFCCESTAFKNWLHIGSGCLWLLHQGSSQCTRLGILGLKHITQYLRQASYSSRYQSKYDVCLYCLCSSFCNAGIRCLLWKFWTVVHGETKNKHVLIDTDN